MNSLGGSCRGVSRPAYLNRLLCTLLRYLFFRLSLDDGSIVLIIIASMGSFAFTPPSQVYHHQSILSLLHNPFFVGALVAIYFYTAVMYDAP